MEVRFVIKARKVSGEVFECFHWTRDAVSGVERAKSDAVKFGIELAEVWAEEIV